MAEQLSFTDAIALGDYVLAPRPMETTPTRRVLRVEDEELIREILAEELREEGFEVIEAGTGDEAIRLLEEHADFDVVCTDVRMPGKADGIDVAVHARGRIPTVPVLVVSGYASELGRRLEAVTPRAAFLPKPFRFSQVSQALRALLPAYESHSVGMSRTGSRDV